MKLLNKAVESAHQLGNFISSLYTEFLRKIGVAVGNAVYSLAYKAKWLQRLADGETADDDKQQCNDCGNEDDEITQNIGGMHDLALRDGQSQGPRCILYRRIENIAYHTRLRFLHDAAAPFTSNHLAPYCRKSFEVALFIGQPNLICHDERLVRMRTERSVTGNNVRISLFANLHAVGKALQGGKRNRSHIASKKLSTPVIGCFCHVEKIFPRRAGNNRIVNVCTVQINQY